MWKSGNTLHIDTAKLGNNYGVSEILIDISNGSELELTCNAVTACNTVNDPYNPLTQREETGEDNNLLAKDIADVCSDSCSSSSDESNSDSGYRSPPGDVEWALRMDERMLNKICGYWNGVSKVFLCSCRDIDPNSDLGWCYRHSSTRKEQNILSVLGNNIRSRYKTLSMI